MDELIRKQGAIDALSKLMVPYGDGSFPGDDEKMAYDEAIVDAIHEIENLPPANDELLQKIEEGIKATTPTDEYSVGMRNGMKWCKSLLDGKEPKYDIVQPKYKKRRR